MAQVVDPGQSLGYGVRAVLIELKSVTRVDPLDSCAEVAFTAPYAPWSPAAFAQTGKAAMARTEITICSLFILKTQCD